MNKDENKNKMSSARISFNTMNGNRIQNIYIGEMTREKIFQLAFSMRQACDYLELYLDDEHAMTCGKALCDYLR